MVKIRFTLLLAVSMSLPCCSQSFYDSMTHADSLPVVAHENGIIDFVARNLVYPESAIKDSIQGKVTISFIVDTLCKTSSFEIAKGIRPDLDSAAMMVVKEIKFVKPAMLNNKRINYKYYLPVIFDLNE